MRSDRKKSRLFRKGKHQKQSDDSPQAEQREPEEPTGHQQQPQQQFESDIATELPKKLTSSLQENLRRVRQLFGESDDLQIRDLRLGGPPEVAFALLYIDGLADKEIIQEFILFTHTLHVKDLRGEEDGVSGELFNLFSMLGPLKRVEDLQTLAIGMLSGLTLILIDGHTIAFSASTEGWRDRGVQEPTSQSVVRGPKDGFTETLRTNTALLRRRIKDPNLWIESDSIGRVTQTDIAMMYIKGLANEEVLKEVRTRLGSIDIDGILESGYIEELIEEKGYTPFPTVYSTERPDVIAAGLLEGRVAILVDGTPYVLMVPALFVQFFQASEDYYQRADIATLIRLLRYLAFFIALLAPALYIAISTFHQEMLPTALLISLVSQREGIPFPAFVEAMMMEVVFEILREAGVRLPRAVGQAVSIVGALVIGQAAVEAGLVSSAMVIVVSLTAISNFVLPAFNMAITIRMLRFVLMILAAAFGLFGITSGLIALVLHLAHLKSFGIPYLGSISPFSWSDQQDAIIRLPRWMMLKRPHAMRPQDLEREGHRTHMKNNEGETS